MAESFRGTDDDVLDYFAIIIGSHGEIFGKRPPSTKLEMIEKDEFRKGFFRKNLSEFVYLSTDIPQFTELMINPKSLPKVLEWLKLQNLYG